MPDDLRRPLTAELCARAIVAAARVYGDPPLHVLGVERSRTRRALMPAATALNQATGATYGQLGRVLAFNPQHRLRALEKGGDRFAEAVTQALLAMGGAELALQPVVATEAVEPPPRAELTAQGGSARNRELLAAAVRRRAAQPRPARPALGRMPGGWDDDGEPVRGLDGRPV